MAAATFHKLMLFYILTCILVLSDAASSKLHKARPVRADRVQDSFFVHFHNKVSDSQADTFIEQLKRVNGSIVIGVVRHAGHGFAARLLSQEAISFVSAWW